MNARELGAIPIPVDVDGRLVRVMVVLRDGGWRTAWGMDGCRRPEPFGPAYVTARAACADQRAISDRSGA